MHGWIAQYEEGYVTNNGERVQLVCELRRERVWETADDALREWLSLAGLAGARLELHGNGFIQNEDVRHRPKFQELGVDQIWRKVTFVPSQDSVRMNPRISVNRSDAT